MAVHRLEGIKPLPKERPRLNRRTGKAFTPARTRKYETDLRSALAEKWDSEPMAGPVHVHVKFHENGISFEVQEMYYVEAVAVRGDLDNLVKAFLDAAQGVLFEDDSQVVSLSAWKL